MSGVIAVKLLRIGSVHSNNALSLTFISTDDTSQAVRALNDGEAELFEKKLSKEEKKARAKAAREAKRSTKQKPGEETADADDAATSNTNLLEAASIALSNAKELAAGKSLSTADDGLNHEGADALASASMSNRNPASRTALDVVGPKAAITVPFCLNFGKFFFKLSIPPGLKKTSMS